MAVSKPVWGIDLGQSALKAIRLRLAGDRVEAVDHVYIEHHRILSQPEVDRAALVAEAMKKFTADHDLSKETLVVGVPGQNTLARFTKLPPVKANKIPEIVKYEAQQQIPFDMEEVIWDYQTFEDATTKETQVGIFAMRRELLRSHLSFLSELNLEPAIVQSSPLALYNALKYDGIVGAEPVCILDIGAQNTDLIVVDGDSLWTRNIPIGGNNFTDALLKTFKLSFSKAERLKRDAGTHKYARQIFQAMRPVFADLVAEVQRSIGFFTSSRRGIKLTKVLAMGNAFKLPGMTKFVQQNLGMDVIRPNAFNKLVATEDPKAPELMDQLLSFAVPYGLALQGLGKAPITSNLLPPEIAKQVVWRRKTPWFYGAAACLVASAAVVWVRNTMDNTALAAAGHGSANRPAYNPSYDAKDTNQLNPVPDPLAIQVVQNGPSANTPLEYANIVLAAGQHLSEVRQKIETSNDAEISKADNLAKLQTHKTVWPKIIELVHGALPVGDKQLDDALKAGPEAVKKLIASNPARYERGKREKIYIEKFEAVYSPDVVNAFLARTKGPSTGFGGTPIGGGTTPTDTTSGETPKPGFVISILGRTPFKGKGQGDGGVFFVNNTFVKNLAKAATDGVYLDKVGAPLRSTPIKTLKRGSSSSSLGGAGRFGGLPMGMGGGGLMQADDKDPITGETVDDIEFEMVFVAVIGNKAAEQPGATPAASPAPAPGEAPAAPTPAPPASPEPPAGPAGPPSGV